MKKNELRSGAAERIRMEKAAEAKTAEGEGCLSGTGRREAGLSAPTWARYRLSWR